MADRLGSILPPLRDRRLDLLPGTFGTGFPAGITADGYHGGEYPHIHAADEGALSSALVRHRSRGGRDPLGLLGPVAAHRPRDVSAGCRPGAAPLAGSQLGSDFAVLVIPVLPLRPPERITRVQPACHLCGAVGGADGIWAVPESVSRERWRAFVGTHSADAVGHRHGDGIVRERAQCGSGKRFGAFHPGRGSGPRAGCEGTGTQYGQHFGAAGGASAHTARHHLHLSAVAQGAALGATWIFLRFHHQS